MRHLLLVFSIAVFVATPAYGAKMKPQKTWSAKDFARIDQQLSVLEENGSIPIPSFRTDKDASLLAANESKHGGNSSIFQEEDGEEPIDVISSAGQEDRDVEQKAAALSFDERRRLFDEHEKSHCDYGKDQVRTINCMNILDKIAKKELPQKPVLYALKAVKKLHGQTCQGRVLKNGCMVIVADLDHKYKEGKTVFNFRHPTVFINLCVGDSKRTSLKDVAYETYTNRGTGSMADRSRAYYTDLNGIKTTLAGLFYTNDLTAFHPYKSSVSKYRNLLGYSSNDERCKGKGSLKNGFLKDCPVLRLGLNRLGESLSVGSKPMHTSPFKSSSGCPSLSKKDNWMMRHMGSYDTSLYIGYTEHKTHKSFFDLENFCKT